ncbi:MAG: glycosyltransferase family 2 protein [Candidatus Omnitrophica bacterium]|nr:glycosyltransferase family 2 protein [Candidatus Omnitrophota bacterium]
MPLLSVIIPVYNEAETIKEVIEKVRAIDIDKEIIVVNDGSYDDTYNILNSIHYDNLLIIHHTSNRGKGSAVRTGLSYAKGDFVIMQDADLEYNPYDYFKLIEAMNQQGADIVLGVRFLSGYKGMFIHRMGNRFLTGLVNLLFGANLNDCFSCYKLLRRSKIEELALESDSFDIEIEIIVKALKRKLKTVQVPISYTPRSYREGKKIRCRDGLYAALSIFKYRFK